MKKIFIIIAILVILLATPFVWYKISTSPVSKSEEKIQITIDMGSGTNKIAKILKENKIIKSEMAFKIYTKLNKVSSFQAGNYELTPSMEIDEIIQTLQTGKLHSKDGITITFIEGKTMRWIAKEIAKNTNNTEEDVFDLLKDEEYIDSLVEKYWFVTNDIKSKDIYYPLEGYIFPDTYTFKNKDVSVEDIFKTMLDKMEKVLNSYKNDIEKSEHNAHEILTMASIVEKEAMHDEDRKDVASVLYNRLEEKMSLGSDVTTYYAIKVEVGERDLYQKELNLNNPYNTRGPNMIGKLSVGPICTVSEKSIEASLKPSNTQYLFFVADKNGKIYFTRTNSEHTSKVNELKNSGLWYEF